MAVNIGIYDKGQSAPITTTKSTLAWVGVSAAGATPGTPESVYEFDSPGTVTSQVGNGPGPEGVAAAVRVSQITQVFVRANAGVPGSNSAVTKSGSGPVITVSGTPYDSFTPVVRIAAAGATGRFKVAMDGATFGSEIDIPAQTSAAVVGTADISAITHSTLNTLTTIVTPTGGTARTVTFTGTTDLASVTSQLNAGLKAQFTSTTDISAITYSTLDTLTLIVTPSTGTALTVTFASTTSGNFLTQINAILGSAATASLVSSQFLRITDAATGGTLTISGSSTAKTILGTPATTTVFAGITASIVRGKYLKLVDGNTGTASTLTVGAGTANTILGLTAGAVTGAAATYVIPNTGLTLTFAVGAYVLGEDYTWVSTEPRITTADLIQALTALADKQVYFRDIVLLTDPVDGADARAIADQFGTTLRTLRGAEPRIFALGFMNGSVGDAADINANDTDVKASFVGHVEDYLAVCHGDVYMQGTAVLGRFRRPLVYAVGIRAAAYGISNDPGDRELPALEEAYTVASNLITRARDENTAVTKMKSARFTTMKSVQSQPYVVQGITRSVTPSFSELGTMRVAIECARVLYIATSRYENAKRFLAPDGTLSPGDAVAIQRAVENEIDEAVGDDISGRIVTIDTKSKVATTKTLNIAVDIQHLAYFFNVNVSIGVVDVLSTPTG